jgi:hypothetical protein
MADADDLYDPGPYAPMALAYDEDPKVAALARFGEDAGLCRDLHLAVIRYGNRARTDGLVSTVELRRLAYPLPPDRADQIIEHLADAELIAPVDGATMATAIGSAMPVLWRAINWTKWNRTAEWLARQSEQRSEAGKLGAKVRWERREPARRKARMAGAMAPAKQSPRQNLATSTGTSTDKDNVRTTRTGSEPAPAATDDDFHHQIVALLAGTGHTVTYADAVVIVETMLIGRKPRDPRAYVLRAVRNDPAAAVRLLVRKPERPVVRPALEVLAEDNHGGTDRVAEHAEEARRLLGVQPPERPEGEPDLVAAGEEDDRLARQKARARARDAEPAQADPGVDAELPDW